MLHGQVICDTDVMDDKENKNDLFKRRAEKIGCAYGKIWHNPFLTI